MKVHDLKDKEGRIFAFEVGNTFLSRRRLYKIAKSIPETKIIKAPKIRHFFRSVDEFCEFEVQGQKFVAWEPWGDNDHYWIGPQPPLWCKQVEIVRSRFVNYKVFGFLT